MPCPSISAPFMSAKAFIADAPTELIPPALRPSILLIIRLLGITSIHIINVISAQINIPFVHKAIKTYPGSIISIASITGVNKEAITFLTHESISFESLYAKMHTIGNIIKYINIPMAIPIY